jgi:hypothetical protein
MIAQTPIVTSFHMCLSSREGESDLLLISQMQECLALSANYRQA